MSRQLIIRSAAEVELAEAFDWYEKCVPGLGSGLILSVDATMHSIVRNPQQYPIVYKTIRRALTKRFPYAILFVAETERTVVLAFFHAKRNPMNWQNRS